MSKWTTFKIRIWKERLGVSQPIMPLRIHHSRVYNADTQRMGASFVGISEYYEEIDGYYLFHTRKLREDDIIHEIAHKAYPGADEAEINRLTSELVSYSRSKERI